MFLELQDLFKFLNSLLTQKLHNQNSGNTPKGLINHFKSMCHQYFIQNYKFVFLINFQFKIFANLNGILNFEWAVHLPFSNISIKLPQWQFLLGIQLWLKLC